jgi:integrase
MSYIAAIVKFLQKCGRADFRVSFKEDVYETDFGNDPVNEEKTPTPAEIAKIIEYLPIQAKALTLVLSSSGMRIGEALSLRISDVELDKNPVRVSIKAVNAAKKQANTKTRHARITFISSEAKTLLQEWLEYRPEYIRYHRGGKPIKEKPGYLAYQRGEKEIKEDDGRLFPFSGSNVETMWKFAVTKAGLGEKNEWGNGRLKLRIHNLRSFFRMYGGWTQLDVPEALIGHASGSKSDNGYKRFDQAEPRLAEEYLRCEKNLSIYEHEQAKNVTELKQKVEKQSDDITQLVTTITLKNSKLEQEVAGWKDYFQYSLTDTAKTIGELQEEVRILQEIANQQAEQLERLTE